MKINYTALAFLLSEMEVSSYYCFKTKNNINGNNKKIVVYNDMTFTEPNPSHEFDNILISTMSTRELNELKKELLSRGFSERSGGGA